jgi:hypothetical protein
VLPQIHRATKVAPAARKPTASVARLAGRAPRSLEDVLRNAL